MISMEEGHGDNRKDGFNKYACASAIVGSMISIIFGYDTGVMSGAMIFIEEDLKINDTQVEVLAGILNMCALFGALIAGRTSDLIGRRYTIALASMIFLLGSVLMGYGPNFGVLLAGRCTAGIGVGFALMIAPVYAAEISAASSRGFLTSLPELCISIGILLGYVSNYFFAKLTLKLGWRMMLGVAAIPSLALALGILKMPESPRWLVLQGRLGDAKKVLLQVSNSTDEAEARLHSIKLAVGIDENCTQDIVNLPRGRTTGKGVWRELVLRPTPTVRWILLAAIGIHFFEHATGIEAVILYSPRIFRKAGVHSKSKLLLATIGVGLTKTVCVMLATCLIDRAGRRKLLLTSTIGMIISLSTLGAALTIVENSKQELLWALVLSICATYAFVSLYSLGLAPVTWVYGAEIFPLKLRSQGVAIGVAMNRFMNATVSMTFLSISKALTIGGSFFLFASISVVALFFFYFLLPETKGKSLEEIVMLFTRESKEPKSAGVELQPKPNDD